MTKSDMAKSLARRNAQLADYAALPAIRPQLERMHRLYTIKGDAQCGDCVQCRKLKTDGRLTCAVYFHETHKAPYWLAEWAACGLFEEMAARSDWTEQDPGQYDAIGAPQAVHTTQNGKGRVGRIEKEAKG